MSCHLRELPKRSPLIMRERTGHKNRRKSVIPSRSAVVTRGVKSLERRFAAALRQVRVRKRISLAGLARKTGLELEFVKQVDRGEIRSLTLGQMEAFAKGVGVSVAHLVRRRRPAAA